MANYRVDRFSLTGPILEAAPHAPSVNSHLRLNRIQESQNHPEFNFQYTKRAKRSNLPAIARF